MTNIALKPCPFCGGRAQPPQPYGVHPNYVGRFIECEQCHASIWRTRPTDAETDAALAEAWNARVPPSAEDDADRVPAMYACARHHVGRIARAEVLEVANWDAEGYFIGHPCPYCLAPGAQYTKG